jgi:hypothetical protein
MDSSLDDSMDTYSLDDSADSNSASIDTPSASDDNSRDLQVDIGPTDTTPSLDTPPSVGTSPSINNPSLDDDPSMDKDISLDDPSLDFQAANSIAADTAENASVVQM